MKFEPLKVINEWTGPWRAYLAEFLATFAFVLISSTVVLIDFLYGDISNVGIGLTIGFSYAALVYATVHLSGGFLNPAVTVALWLAQKLTTAKTIFLISAQVLASFVAAGVVLLIFNKEVLEFTLGSPTLGLGVTAETGLIVEGLFCAILIFAVFATMVDKNGPVSFGPLVLGLILTSLTIVSLPISGAGLNPVRAIGPQILSNSWQNTAVYIIGPLIGSLFGIVYEFIFLKRTNRNR